MSMLSPRLQLKVQQKQILTPGLVQMVTVLQLNRLELKDKIMEELAENPLLEESTGDGDELTPQEVQQLLESEQLRDPSDSAILDAVQEPAAAEFAVDGYMEVNPANLSSPVVDGEIATENGVGPLPESDV